jgi:hypothetical protein
VEQISCIVPRWIVLAVGTDADGLAFRDQGADDLLLHP